MNQARNHDMQWRRSRSCEAGACVEVTRSGDEVLLRASQQPHVVLHLSDPEWTAFKAGMADRDFDDV